MRYSMPGRIHLETDMIFPIGSDFELQTGGIHVRESLIDGREDQSLVRIMAGRPGGLENE